MIYLIPKASMHPVEKATVLGGLIIFGLGVVASTLLGADPAAVFTLVGLVATLSVVLNPAGRLEYQVEPEGLRVGARLVPFAALADAQLVRLSGTVVYGGITLPGYWYGRAWSRRLGHFVMCGSTGVGEGVLLTLSNGKRLVITPANPLETVIRLLVVIRSRSTNLARPPLHSIH